MILQLVVEISNDKNILSLIEDAYFWNILESLISIICKRLRKDVFLVCQALAAEDVQRKERGKKMSNKKLYNFWCIFLSEFENATFMFIHSSSDLRVYKIHSR
jgi:hypothetical protein